MQPGWNTTCKDCTCAIAPQTPWRKPRRYAVSAHLLAQSPGSDSSRTPPAWPSRAPQGGAGTPPGNGGDGAERHEAGIGQRIEARCRLVAHGHCLLVEPRKLLKNPLGLRTVG